MDGTQVPFDRLGSYRIVRRIATGGTSDVLLAKAEGPLGFERQVVLKILRPQYRADDQFVQMFAREAAAYARLSHAAVVRLFDFFEHGEQLVMVLEFVDGLPLNRLRASLKDFGKTLPDTAALYIASHVFEALASAHDWVDPTGQRAPVIHRDVNPSNVLVGWNGEVKLADFGIARVTGVRSNTQSGLIQGTFGYMAPEQVTGADIGTHSDVYAAGLLLWEMLAHRKAIQRGALPEVEILRAMAEPHIVSLDILRPDLHGRVREVVSRALEPDPRKRTITAEEAWCLLRDVLGPRGGRSEIVELAKLIHDRATVKVRAAEPSEPPPSPSHQASPRPPAVRAPARVSAPTPAPTPARVPAPTPAPARVRAPTATPAPAPVRVPPPATTRAADRRDRLPPREPGEPDELEPIDIDKLFDGIELPNEPDSPSPVGDELTVASVAPPAFDVESLLTESRRAFAGTPNGVPAVRPATSPPRKSSEGPPRPQIRPSRRVPAVALPNLDDGPIRRASQELTAVVRLKPGETTQVASQFPPPAGLPKGLTPRQPEVAPISVTIPSVKSTLIMPVADMRTSAPPPPLAPSVPPPGASPPSSTGRAAGVAEAKPSEGDGAALSASTQSPRVPVAPAPETTRGLPPGPGAEPEGSSDGRRPPPIPGGETLPLSTAPAPALGVAPSAPAPMPDALQPPGPTFVPFTPPAAPFELAPAAPIAFPTAAVPPAFAPAPVAFVPFFTPGRIAAVVVVMAVSAAVGVAYVKRSSFRAPTGTSAAPAPTPSGEPSAAPAPTPSAEPSAAPAPTPSAEPSAAAPAPATASAVPETPSSPSSPSTAEAPGSAAPADSPKVPANMCLLKTTGATPGRRVFVDGRAVVETPGEARVPCGSRSVQVGSAGKARTLDLPCGVEYLVK